MMMQKTENEALSTITCKLNGHMEAINDVFVSFQREKRASFSPSDEFSWA
jgi:hypothetical protein